MSVDIKDVIAMLEHFPLDGLRKAAETYGLAVPLRKLAPGAQMTQLIAALSAGLLAKTLAYAKPGVDSEPMWEECRQYAGTVPMLRAQVDPTFTFGATERVALAKRIESIVQDMGGVDALAGICAGKASSETRTPEKSAYMSRWATRYGRKSTGYTHMRRLFADTTGNPDYAARETTALAIEEHAFSVLRHMLGATHKDKLGFSNEPGRAIQKDKSRKPEWGIFVYLAIKQKHE